MNNDIVRSIVARGGYPDLVNILAEKLSGTELSSLLLEVFAERANALTPPKLLNQYQLNRFVKPSDLPVLEMKQMEIDVLKLFAGLQYQPLDLAPVSIFGSCSAVAPADQKKVLSALRGTEVLADSTNAIALHYCDLKEQKLLSNEPAKFCNVQRQVRTQAIAAKGFTPHFRIGCLVSFGTDTGSYQFEKNALSDHVRAMKQLFLNYYGIDRISFRLLRRPGYAADFLHEVGDYVQQQNPESNISLIEEPQVDIRYYKGIQYKVDIQFAGNTYEIADGGFVDWTQQLLQNKKERMLSSGFGFDFMYRILHNQL